MKRCYVLLVNWNGWFDTIECLESLFSTGCQNPKVVVCDNGSDDGSLHRIREWARGNTGYSSAPGSPLGKLSRPEVAKPIPFAEYDRTQAEKGGDTTIDPELVLIDTVANLGFAGGNNVGLRYLMSRPDFDYVWLLNNDTVVAANALQALVDRMEVRPDAGMCGSTLLHYDDPDKVQARGGGWYCKWLGLPWHLGQLRHADAPVNLERIERWMSYVVGASLFVSRDFLEEIGLMTEDYFLFYEELDWAVRSRGRFRMAYAPLSRVYHKIGGSVGTSSNPCRKSRTCDFYAIRNRLLFTRRFHPKVLPTIYLSVLTALLVRLMAGHWSRAGMIWRLLTSRDLIRETVETNGQS